MKLLRLDEIAPDDSELVFRETVVGRTLLLFFLAAVGLGWCLAPIAGWLGWFAALLFGAPCLLATALALPGVARGWRSDRWVLSVRLDGLAIQVRSCLNADLDDGRPTVAWIPCAEIASVRRVDRHDAIPDSDGGTLGVRSQWLEIRLTHGDTGELASLIARDRGARGAGRVHHHAYPLTQPAPDTLRVSWRDAGIALSPSLRHALVALRRSQRVMARHEEPERDWRTLPDAELEGYARELVLSGRILDAVRLLRERRGWDLARSMRCVRELTQEQRAA